MALRYFSALMSGLAIFLSSVAVACPVEFVGPEPSVTFNATGNYPNRDLRQTVTLQLRNTSDTQCTVRVGVGLDAAIGDPDFPVTQISGPLGLVQLSQLSTVAANAGRDNASVHVIDGNSVLTLTYNLAVDAGWDNVAGSYLQRLTFPVFADGEPDPVATRQALLAITIPATANIRFAGNSDQLALGDLSPTRPTYSPPFAIKVYSTAPFQLAVSSQYQGQLKRDGGGENIGYALSIGGQGVSLSGAGDIISGGEATGGLGDTRPISVTVPPIGNALAGTYRDRVTVSVTTL